MKALNRLFPTNHAFSTAIPVLILCMALISCSQITDYSDEANSTPSAAEMGISGDMNSDEMSGSDEDFTITLNCSGSINAGDDPLFIVDGVEMSFDPDDNSKLKSINPKDIESIEVLKDPDALAEYGEDPEGGVVLITTKKHSSSD